MSAIASGESAAGGGGEIRGETSVAKSGGYKEPTVKALPRPVAKTSPRNSDDDDLDVDEEDVA